MKDQLRVSDEQINDFIEILANSKTIPSALAVSPGKLFYSGIVPCPIDTHSVSTLPVFSKKVLVIVKNNKLEFSLMLDYDAPMTEVFEKIKSKTGSREFKLVYKSSIVKLNGRLNEYNITSGSVVFLV